jgi:hypothetical protein
VAWHDVGNKPINSTFLPVAGGSTATLYAELDSTQLGTASFRVGQSMIVQATYILSADSNASWQVGSCASTALNAGVDEFYPKTAPSQAAQYVVQHTLEKDHRLRVRAFSTNINGAAYISCVPLT